MSTQRLVVTLSVALAVVVFMLAQSVVSDNPIEIKRQTAAVSVEVEEDAQPEPTPALTQPPLLERVGNYTTSQTRLLRIAYEEGVRVGWPETIQAILLQESTAGAHGPVGDRTRGFGNRSYCHMQVKLVAAKDALRHFPELGNFATDEELLAALLTDDRFCIRVGAHYFKVLADRTDSWSQAVLSYNRGLRGALSGEDPMDYIGGIRKKINQWIRPHQQQLARAHSDQFQIAANYTGSTHF